jgi:predicted nuclease with TOPRIM domain
VECEGSEEFIRVEVPRLLETFTKTHNGQTKTGLLEALTGLEGDRAAMDEHIRNISLVDAQLGEVVQKFQKEIAGAINRMKQLPNPSPEIVSGASQMEESEMSFNLQYLQLQSQMQNESRSYTAISNIMKTKHDTVKNSISNIR